MDIFKIALDKGYNLVLQIGPIGLIILFFIIILIIYKYWPKFNLRRDEFEIDEAELGVGQQRIRIKPNYEDMQIAYQLYIELSTRKIGLPINFDDDYLIEIYDSWYEFFKITREHIKSIPAQKVKKSEDTRKIVNIAIEVLNNALRPHLTKYQARFRNWYEKEKEKSVDIDPQEIQKKYPQYQELKSDMEIVNQNLIKYRRILKQIAMGKD